MSDTRKAVLILDSNDLTAELLDRVLFLMDPRWKTWEYVRAATEGVSDDT